ncbi:chemotaxis response regulator protein-glutamate methylesterase, partial [bacterium]|nr:chemotaxis response regulator protein-glutamate methylesterase [bacterium]
RAGAVDFIAKPSGELSLDIEKIREDILKKIHTAKLARIRRFPGTKKRSGKVSFKNIKGSKIIVIGASTGGPPVVEDILLALPKNIPATIFVAQHMPDFFISRFAERLDKLMDLKVKVLSDNSLIAPKQVIIVNDNFKIIGDKIKRIKICKVDEECGARPSIDSTMISLSKAYGKKVIGIMLSGMGEDGFEGFKEIRRNKGFTIAQDLKTAVITSMPETVIEAGLTDSVLSPNKIAKKIIELCSE